MNSFFPAMFLLFWIKYPQKGMKSSLVSVSLCFNYVILPFEKKKKTLSCSLFNNYYKYILKIFLYIYFKNPGPGIPMVSLHNTDNPASKYTNTIQNTHGWHWSQVLYCLFLISYFIESSLKETRACKNLSSHPQLDLCM